MEKLKKKTVEEVKADETYQSIQIFKEIKEESENEADSDVQTEMQHRFKKHKTQDRSSYYDESDDDTPTNHIFTSQKVGYGGSPQSKLNKDAQRKKIKEKVGQLFGRESSQDSDDIEKQKRMVREKGLPLGPHLNQKYLPEEVIASAFGNNHTAKGFKALDDESETVTENSDQDGQDPTTVRPRMFYSTKLDQ